MATSSTYWNVVLNVQTELNALSGLGDDAQSALESHDDPTMSADSLAEIEKRLTKLVGQLGPNIVALRKVGKALSEIPGVK